ncbi:MAG: tetratricopeptide repeat protein [Chloroflexi bacterium]|nr:tetratricopeptide repeat protein [Chloroflexota bacterium]
MMNLESILDEIKKAKFQGESLREGQACAMAGKLLLERNIYPEAAHYFQNAALIFAAERDISSQAKALNHLGVCLVMTNQAELALEHLSQAKELLNNLNDPALLAAIEGNIGLVHSTLNDYTNAIKAHKSVMEAAEELQDDTLKLNALINLADSNLQNKYFQPALGFALVALDLAKDLKSPQALMIIYDLLGMITSRQGDLKYALEYHQQAYQTAHTEGDLLRQGIALANQALALEGLTELTQAFELMQEAESLFILLNSDYQEKTRRDLVRIQSGLP